MRQEPDLEVRVQFLKQVLRLFRGQDFITTCFSYNEDERRAVYEENTRSTLQNLEEQFGQGLQGLPEAQYLFFLTRYEELKRTTNSEEKQLSLF